MAQESDVLSEDAPLLPPHTKQAGKALGKLLVFSFLMFTLPFAAFFGTKHLLRDYFHITGFANTVWSVSLAVITVNIIIAVYSYIAYNEPEFDEHGNPILEEKNKTEKKKH